MRILLITDNHTPTGGAEKVFFDLKSRLAARPGHRVFSIGFANTASETEDSLVLKKPSSLFAKLWWQLFTHRNVHHQLRSAIHAFAPDIIHLHNIKQHTAALLNAVKSYPCLQTLHDYSVVCPTAHNIHRDLSPCPTGFTLRCAGQHRHKHPWPVYMGLTLSFLLQRLRTKKRVHRFLAVSPLLAQYAAQHFNAPVSYLPPFTLHAQPQTQHQPDPTHFLYLGHLGSHKGLTLLLREFALAVKQNPNLKLTIAGDGPEKTRLMHDAKMQGIDHHLHFIGWQTNPAALYETHIATLVPSLWMEAFGLIVTESMAHARAVIGSNRGSLPWLITNQETGLLFDPLTPGDLAQKILDLAEHPEKARAMGLCGQAKLNHLIDNEKTLETLLKTYRDTIIHCHTRRPLAPVRP